MLQPANRLKTDQDFKKILKYGRSFYSLGIKIKLMRNNLPKSRFGFIIGTKISKKATVRNRLKRQVREIIRLLIKDGVIKNGFDVVVLIGGGMIGKNYQEIKKEVFELFKKSNLFDV